MSEKRILVIDDEQAILEMLKDMFSFLKIEADLIGTSKEAVEKVRANPGLYLPVLLDINLPDADGSETFDQLIKIAPHLQIYVFSGFGESEMTDELLKKGAVGVIPKPFKFDDLKVLIDQIKS